MFGSALTQTNGRMFLANELACSGSVTANSANNTILVNDGTDFVQDSWVSFYSLYCQSSNLFFKTAFTGDIVLQGANTIAVIYSPCQFESKFFLNGGTIKLGRDLFLKSGSYFYGPGTIDLNGFTLYAEHTSFSGNINFVSGGEIALSGVSVVSGTLTIDTPTTKTSVIIGGTIDFVQNASSGLVFTGLGTPKLNNCNLLGLGNNNNLGAGISSAQELQCAGVYFELSQTFTQSSNFRISGEGAVVAAMGNIWYVAGTLTIDTATLFYSRANQSSPSPIVTTGAGTIALVGSGRQAPVQGLTGRNGLPGAAGRNGDWFAAAKTMTQVTISGGDPQQLNATNRITFSGTPQAIYDGGGAILTGAAGTSNNITLGNGVTLVWTNITLHGIFESNYTFGTSAAVVFGDKTTININRDLILSGTSRTMTFSGNSSINGLGHFLTLGGAGNILVKSGGRLTVKNTILNCTVNNAITMESNTSTLVIKDSIVELAPVGFVFSNGNLLFSGNSKIITAGNFTGVDNSVTFSYSSQGVLGMDKNSSLTLDPGVIFNFRPNLNFRQPFSSSKGFVFSGPSSSLILDGATLMATYSGLELSNGTIFAQRASGIIMDANTDNNLIILNNFDMQIASDASLWVKGTVKIL